jgi:hypothetical protein
MKNGQQALENIVLSLSFIILANGNDTYEDQYDYDPLFGALNLMTILLLKLKSCDL